jgi:hypothetical protein
MMILMGLLGHACACDRSAPKEKNDAARATMMEWRRSAERRGMALSVALLIHHFGTALSRHVLGLH